MIVVIYSGGLDSTTLLYDLVEKRGEEAVLSLSFNYGQRHQKELSHARRISNLLGVQHIELDFSSLGLALRGNSLTDPRVSVPHGTYTDSSMLKTVVPCRNALFLTAAFAIAESWQGEGVAIGVHSGDHPLYPDCRSSFISSFYRTIKTGLGDRNGLKLFTPFLHWNKAEIVKRGEQLAIPYELTWSCYEGGEFHCGLCGTCEERKEAFREARIDDPTTYVDATGAYRSS